MATRDGTWRYRDRFGDRYGRTYFRRFGPGVVSSIGLGTYLGEPTDAVDADYREAIQVGLESGINVVDTAVNYRCGRSERVVGDAVRAADVDREEVVVATKGGFVPFDGDRPEDPGQYVREQFLETGLVRPEDLARGSHAITPDFLDAMVDRSLNRLRLDTIDCYYVHNPETQLAVRSRDAVYDALEDAFELLERRRLAGDIGRYGVATWDAFRVPPGNEAALSLPELLSRASRAAETVGADEHGLEAIQLPFNVTMADAFSRATQPVADGPGTAAADGTDAAEADGTDAAEADGTDAAETDAVDAADTAEADAGDRRSVLEVAHDAGISVFTSASIGQGELAAGLPERVAPELAGDTAAQRAINFARSAPGVTSALVGASDVAHVRENAAAGTFDPLGAGAFDAVFE